MWAGREKGKSSFQVASNSVESTGSVVELYKPRQRWIVGEMSSIVKRERGCTCVRWARRGLIMYCSVASGSARGEWVVWNGRRSDTAERIRA